MSMSKPPGGDAGWNQMQAAKPTNGFAITALVSSLVLAPLGIIFGHLALRQISRTGENGRGLAVGGLVLGYVFTAVGAIWAIYVLVSLSVFTNILAGGDSSEYENSPSSTSRTITLPAPAATGVHMEVPADGPDLRPYRRGDCLEISAPTAIHPSYDCDVAYSVFGAPVYEITGKTPVGISTQCQDDYLKTVYDIYCLRPYTP